MDEFLGPVIQFPPDSLRLRLHPPPHFCFGLPSGHSSMGFGFRSASLSYWISARKRSTLSVCIAMPFPPTTFCKSVVMWWLSKRRSYRIHWNTTHRNTSMVNNSIWISKAWQYLATISIWHRNIIDIRRARVVRPRAQHRSIDKSLIVDVRLTKATRSSALLHNNWQRLIKSTLTLSLHRILHTMYIKYRDRKRSKQVKRWSRIGDLVISYYYYYVCFEICFIVIVYRTHW